MGRTPRYEYASPSAPWNRAARPKSAEARERLVRKHLDELLPPHGEEKGQYRNAFYYRLTELLAQIVHEKQRQKTRPYNTHHDPQPEMGALELEADTPETHSLAYRIARQLTWGHAWRYPRNLPPIITHEERERIVQHLVEKTQAPLYSFTVQERIRQCDEHQRNVAGPRPRK